MSKHAVANHRRERALNGFVRVEVSVRREDATLIRRAVAALADPLRQAEARALLINGFGEPAPTNLKALLAEAPLEGITLDRDRDVGRDIDR